MTSRDLGILILFLLGFYSCAQKTTKPMRADLMPDSTDTPFERLLKSRGIGVEK